MRVIVLPTVCVDVTEPGKCLISGYPGASGSLPHFQGLGGRENRQAYGSVTHSTIGDDLLPVGQAFERRASSYIALARTLARDAGWTGDFQVIVCREWHGGPNAYEAVHIKIKEKGAT